MDLSWQAVLMLSAALLLVGAASYGVWSRAPFPKQGMRQSEKLIIASGLVVVAASLAIADVRTLWRPRARVSAASAVATPRASCASVDVGMTETEVTTRLGAPDRRLPDEETRGPSAAVLLYDSSRCTVHVFNGRVEFVD